MQHTVLKGKHVRLEPLAVEHLDGLCAVGLDEEIWRWFTAPVRTPEEMRDYIREALAARDRGEILTFATIALKPHAAAATPDGSAPTDPPTRDLPDGGRIVGSTSYRNIDLANRRLEIGGTWIARAWQRTAINTEAKLLMLRQAFLELGCHRVELKTDALNVRSRAAIRRLGAVEEGTLRKHMVTASGRIRDSVYFSITDDEWPEVERRLLEKLAAHAGPQ